MKLEIYTIYDAAIDAYGRPTFMRSRGEAMRMFTDVANDKQTNIGQHPSDFGLFYLGDFDDVNGVFDLEKVPVSLGLAQEYLERE